MVPAAGGSSGERYETAEPSCSVTSLVAVLTDGEAEAAVKAKVRGKAREAEHERTSKGVACGACDAAIEEVLMEEVRMAYMARGVEKAHAADLAEAEAQIARIVVKADAVAVAHSGDVDTIGMMGSEASRPSAETCEASEARGAPGISEASQGLWASMTDASANTPPSPPPRRCRSKSKDEPVAIVVPAAAGSCGERHGAAERACCVSSPVTTTGCNRMLARLDALETSPGSTGPSHVWEVAASDTVALPPPATAASSDEDASVDGYTTAASGMEATERQGAAVGVPPTAVSQPRAAAPYVVMKMDGPQLQEVFQRIASRDPSLSSLDLDGHPVLSMWPLAWQATALGLARGSPVLRSLSLCRLCLTDAIVPAIASLLDPRANGCLECLHLEDNQLTEKGILELLSGLATNRTLAELCIGEQREPLSTTAEVRIAETLLLTVHHGGAAALLAADLPLHGARACRLVTDAIARNVARLSRARDTRLAMDPSSALTSPNLSPAHNLSPKSPPPPVLSPPHSHSSPQRPQTITFTPIGVGLPEQSVELASHEGRLVTPRSEATPDMVEGSSFTPLSLQTGSDRPAASTARPAPSTARKIAQAHISGIPHELCVVCFDVPCVCHSSFGGRF